MHLRSLAHTRGTFVERTGILTTLKTPRSGGMTTLKSSWKTSIEEVQGHAQPCFQERKKYKRFYFMESHVFE